MRIYKLILFSIFTIIYNIGFGYMPDSSAIEQVRIDTSEIDLQLVDSSFIQNYTSKEEFIYAEDEIAPETWWQKIIRWLYDVFYSSFNNEQPTHYIWYIAFALLLFLIMLKFLHSDISGLFMTNKLLKTNQLNFNDKNIITQDLEALVNAEVAKGNYQLAIRLLYLNLLKILSEKGLIIWQNDKTNSDYCRELQKVAYYRQFVYLSQMFEYLNYGNFPINREDYFSVKTKFDELIIRIA